MFNGYIAERRQALLRQTAQTKKKQDKIRKRYHTQIQPLLLEHYDKRLKSFIHKMEENPIIINPEYLEPPSMNQSHFIFKSSEDWRSVHPFRQRQEKKRHDKIMKKMSKMNTVATSRDTMQTNLPKIYQFRIRQKSKQLHQSMRFGSEKKPPEIILKARKDLRKNMSAKKQKRRGSITEDNTLGGMLRDTAVSISNSTSKYEQNNETQFNSKERTQFAYRQDTDNIQVEAQLYEKMKQPDEKKLHFKKITDLAIQSKDDHEKRQLKQILRRSGFAKVKPHLRTEQKEADAFSLLIERMSSRDK